MNRLVKQIVYGLFYIAVVTGISFLLYWFLKPNATCFDNRQNQNEEGIDCGGVCARVCIPSDIRDIEVVGSPQAFSPVPGVFGIVARIQNPNLSFAAPSFTYTFRVYDAQDRFVDISGMSHMYAGEAKYITILKTDGSVTIPPVRIARIEALISTPHWIPAKDFSKPALRLQEFRLLQTQNQLVVNGQFTNDDALTLSHIPAIALFYGTFGQLVGFSQTILDGVAPNETRAFTIIHPTIPDVVASSTQVVIIPPARN